MTVKDIRGRAPRAHVFRPSPFRQLYIGLDDSSGRLMIVSERGAIAINENEIKWIIGALRSWVADRGEDYDGEDLDDHPDWEA
jgi:hypothetical protein